MEPSTHQKQVIDWLQADSNYSDAVVNSVAGSGKSTLLKLAADAISTSNVDIRDCLVLVFNKKNKTALVKKLDSRWQYSISTVHRAKGMESERVYIAEPLTLPLLWESQKQWQEQQEQNLLYVALSRSTKDLFLIGDAFWFEHDRPLHGNLVSAENATTDSDGDSVEEKILAANDEKLEHYAKLIRLEQGKRIELNFSSLF